MYDIIIVGAGTAGLTAAIYGRRAGKNVVIYESETYGGQIMKPHNCFTTHGGIIDYKDHSYFFYHKNGLKGGGTFNRSACVEEFTFKSDGSIPLLTMSNEGPKQLEYLDPYKKTEAETICWSEGIKIEKNKSDDGANVSNIQDGSYIKVKGVDFKEGAEKFTISAGSESDGGAIELHLDKKDGPVIGKCDISGTSGWQNFKEFSTKVSGATDVHDLYLVFRGSSSYLFNLDWWQFSSDKVTVTEPTASPTTAPTVSHSPSVSPDGYIFHDTFESSADSWTARGSASVSKSTSSHYAGSAALSITGRENTWNGATKSLSSSQFKAGSEYAFSACFNAPKADEAVEYKLTLQYDDANGDTQYDKIAQTYGNPGEYVQLYNANYKIPSGASNMQIIAETTAGTMDFFIDEVIAAAAGTKIDGPKSIVRTPTDIKGDVDFDKRITVADLVALKSGIINGFSTKAAKSNGDVDKSRETNAEDAMNLQKYLLGTITEFPDNTPPEPPKAEMRTISEYTKTIKVTEKEPDDSKKEKSGVQYGTVKSGTYHSTTCNRDKPYNILLPAGYSADKKYPVLYVMHGYWENQDRMIIKGNGTMYTRQIIGNAIASGEAEDMIVVFPYIYSSATQKDCTAMDEPNNKAYDNFINDLTKDLMPHIEKTYSIKTGRENTAITGFSMGGRESLLIGMKRPDLFGYVGAICPAPGVTGSFKWASEEEAPSLLFITAGSNDTVVYDNPKNYHNNFEKNGVPHIYHYVNGGYHGDNSIHAHIYNFVRYVFKA